ncbi:hypothetical protein B0T18DRAFT_211644 [Schizothecium vesticola]|uniref:Protein prenylyltransferase n=1 Tax=Schizothecium vesticola TaxID=314040 RepID=A0AA40EJM1_9PEZI|nr:hypothetical protein B0T18DRAFT_211644 [Schizothecium vesticola]
MSRALETEVKKSLASANPAEAYDQISRIFLSPPGDALLELEILAKSVPLPEGCHVLQDGHCVGVSKLGLVQAFLVARKILHSHRGGSEQRPDQEALAATAVILLMDPEHLTAANTRKRLLQGQRTLGDSSFSARLLAEKFFLDSLLTSRLHRHTKSPTLWGHLQWLLPLFKSYGLPVDIQDDINKIVFTAGERHPRNYYAWNHARYLLKLHGQPDTSTLQGLLDSVRTWCFQHHTDISGWTFLYVLLSVTAPLDTACPRSVFSQVTKLAKSLQLTNESVWVFLRTLTASSLVGEEEYLEFFALAEDLAETSTELEARSVLLSARRWCETYRSIVETGPSRTTSSEP